MELPFIHIFLFLLFSFGIVNFLFNISFLEAESKKVRILRALTEASYSYRIFLASSSVILLGLSTPSFYEVIFDIDKFPANLLLYSNLIFGLCVLYYLALKHGVTLPVKTIYINILAFAFASFIVIGHSFAHHGDFYYVDRDTYSIVFLFFLFVGFFYYFQCLLSYLFRFLNTQVFAQPNWFETHSLVSISNTKMIIGVGAIIIFCWTPYLVFFYPGILSSDPNLAIRQFLGLPTGNAMSVVLLDIKNPITNHHPYFHTFILGNLVRLGLWYGDFNLGLFAYTLLQLTVFVFALSVAITYLKTLGVSRRWLISITLFFCFVPVFPYYALSVFKDVLYASVFILFVVLMHRATVLSVSRVIRPTISYVLAFCFVSIALILLRHNGLHVFLVSLFFMLWFLPKHRYFWNIICCVGVSVHVIFNFYYLPYIKVSPGPAREKYSVPFQQTARYVKYRPDRVSEQEKELIAAVLPYDSLGDIYTPKLSDPVKSTFNFLATEQEFRGYLRAWVQGLFKEPIVYLEATINNTYLYLYPLEVSWVIIPRPHLVLKKLGYDYNPQNSGHSISRHIVGFGRVFIFLPVVGLTINGAFLVWLVLVMVTYLLYRKYYANLVFFIPYLATIAIFFFSPANGHYRYFLPIVFSAPFLILLFLYDLKRISSLGTERMAEAEPGNALALPPFVFRKY